MPEDSGLGTRDWVNAAALVAAMVALVAGLATVVAGPPAATLSLATAVLLLSVPPVLLALPAWLGAARIAACSPAFRWIAGSALVLASVPERLARGRPSDLLGLALYVGAALLVTADRPREPTALWRDVPLVLLLWLPLEFRVVSGDMAVLKLVGLGLLLLLYVVERPVFALGRILPLQRKQLAWGFGCYAGFLVVAVPLALATGFARPGLADRSPGTWALTVVGVFWITALPEEALFRGAIQQLLGKALGRGWPALALASILFGLAHLNNTADAPDWRYVGLAALAGLAYGFAYERTGDLAAPVLTHFLVDLTWGGLFAG